MKILMLIKRFEIGGAEDNVLELTNGLCNRGIIVHLACKRGRKISELHPSTKFHPIYFKKTLLPFSVLQLIWIIKKNKIDLIHAHQNYPILTACFAGWLTGVPVVATIHGLLKKEIGYKFVQKQLSKMVVVSQNSFVGSQKYPTLKNKTELILNPLPKVNSSPCLFDRTRIVYASRIDRGHYSFLQFLLFNIIPMVHYYNQHIKLQVVGDGCCYHLLKKASEKINSLLDSNVIEVLGYRKNILEVISKAGSVIGVGRVAMQALSIGVPVISANRKHMCSIVDEQNYEYLSSNNFVSVDDPPPTMEQMVQTILQIFSNYDYYREQAVLVAKRIKRDYDSDLIISKTIGIYQNCMRAEIVNEPIALAE